MGTPPGTAVLLDAGQLAVRYPQVSTHTLSLGTLARLIEAAGPRVLLLGVEPESLSGSELSACVRTTVDAVCVILSEVLAMDAIPSGGRS
jgi:hypothetical protein